MNKSSKKLSNFLDFSSPFPCDQHPFSSHDVGICPHCLNERLMILVCSDCGERRLSSCSCSNIRRNSCSTTADFDFATRNHHIHTKPRSSSSFRRSTSTSTSNGFARIKRLFFIKKQNLEFCDDDNFYIGDGGYEARLSCQDQPDRFCSRSVVFPSAIDDDTDTHTHTAFIDLNLHPYPSSSYESKQEIEFCGGRSSMSIASDHAAIYRKNHINFQTTSNGISGNGGSCRSTMDEFKPQRTTRNYKFWKWIFNNGEKKY